MSKSNSSINDKMKEMQNKYSSSNKPELKVTKQEANLMVQMNLYDDNKINNNIMELEEIYDSQVERLNTLKEEDPVACIEKCNNFLEDNNEKIHKQLDKIVDLEKNIKNVIEECDSIELQEEKLNMMIKEPKYVDLAEKIKKMRGTIDNLNFFLVKKKITNYKN
tara:strand:- start:9 stop:500 length:492 start_codon:yes stop_codon:yes gene_type:complete